MLRKLFLLVLFTAAVNAFGQGEFISKNAYISFYSSTPLEDILGESNEAVSILNAETGEIGFQALMTTFHFKRALMEEHFNENFIESDKYPKTKFNGKIENFNKDMLKGAVTNITVTGQLTVHGVEKTITVPATLGMDNGKLVGTAKFMAKPEDYNITIPALVREKIGKEMEVNVKVTYSPYSQ
jgi:hypothetical protein